MQANNTSTQTDPAVAVELIQRWKNDSELRSKYDNNAGAFFIRAEWDQDASLRDEFAGDFESYAAFSRRAGDV